MSFTRVSALRGVLRASRASAARPQVFQQISRRAYSEGHAHKEAGSDLPWLIGAVGVTVPSLYFILAQSSDDSHGHDDHGDSHAKSHKEESKDEPVEEAKDEPEEKSEEPDAGEEKKEESKDEEKDEKKDDDEATESKSEDKKQGEADGPSDEAAPSKAPAETPGTGASTSSKQEGLSNADTKHSTDAANDSTKSKKPEGGLETAKAKGTIDPKREQ